MNGIIIFRLVSARVNFVTPFFAQLRCNSGIRQDTSPVFLKEGRIKPILPSINLLWYEYYITAGIAAEGVDTCQRSSRIGIG